SALLRYYRAAGRPQLRLRAHILLLLADGRPWDDIARALYCSTRTVARWKARFRRHGLRALPGEPAGAPRRLAAGWAALVVTWALRLTPRAFGWLRSRWCCAVLALTLWRRHRVEVSRETVRRWLRQGGLVWRRPRPVLARTDPDREAILGKLRALLRGLPDDETAVFQDEADLNLTRRSAACGWPGGARRRSRRPATTTSATWPARGTGARGRCSRRSGPGGTGRCSCATWTSCGAGCGGTGRSTSSATTPSSTSRGRWSSSSRSTAAGWCCTTCLCTRRSATPWS